MMHRIEMRGDFMRRTRAKPAVSRWVAYSMSYPNNAASLERQRQQCLPRRARLLAPRQLADQSDLGAFLDTLLLSQRNDWIQSRSTQCRW